jgi:hypothetical protein
MKTTKAYLAGIGITGILVGSIVVLLVLGSGIVAFDGLPDLGRPPAPLERVVLKEGGQGANDSDRTRLATRRADRRSAARRLRISPDRAPRGGRRGALGGGDGGGGSPLPPAVDDTVAGAVEGTTGVVGGTLDNVAPGVGAPLTEIGSRLGETIRGVGTG